MRTVTAVNNDITKVLDEFIFKWFEPGSKGSHLIVLVTVIFL